MDRGIFKKPNARLSKGGTRNGISNKDSKNVDNARGPIKQMFRNSNARVSKGVD